MIRSLNRQRFRGVGVFRGALPLCSVSALAVSLAWSHPAAASDPQSPGSEPWWGRDKALHLGFSAGLAATGYGVSSMWLDSAWQRASAGSAFALTLGAGKELADWAGYGHPSYKDMLYNLAGTALGVALAYLVDLATGSGPEPERAKQAGLGRTQPLAAF